MKCIAEIETHDPVGRQVVLHVYVGREGLISYEPKLENGDVLSINSIFPYGSCLPKNIDEGGESILIKEIESKLRYFYSKVKRILV